MFILQPIRSSNSLFYRTYNVHRAIWTSCVNSAMARSVPPGVSNKDQETPSSKAPWLKVRFKNRNVKERIIHACAVDDRIVTEAKDAQKISDQKLEALEKSLTARGFFREMDEYKPPKDLESKIRETFSEIYGNDQLDLDFELTDHVFKFKFLVLCASRFKHEVPNSDLYKMRKIRDVVEFYATPIQGLNNYDKLVRDSDDLPGNLCILPEAKRFNPQDKSFMHGVTALPGMPDTQRGIRAQKKYPSLKKNINWPDI